MAHDGVDALLDVAQHLGGEGEQRDCRRQQSSVRARYVAGESGTAIFALVAEKSRARNSLVQQWDARGVRTRTPTPSRPWPAVTACPEKA